MRIQAGFTIAYDCPQPTPMLLVLDVHPSRRADLLTPQALVFDPPVAAGAYTDGFGNLCTRITAPAGRISISTAFEIADPGLPDEIAVDAVQHDIADLPEAALVHLLASRYCEVDALADLAWSTFAGTRPGWDRVQAICDFVHDRIVFDYMAANPLRTAAGAYRDEVGVCRDFAHLAVALCRAMNIPARYCTGYLGDIGVPASPDPMDFSAWFEVFLGGRWRTLDARHNRPRIGRILMARGRDATDVALTTSFGRADLARFEVTTVAVADPRKASQAAG